MTRPLWRMNQHGYDYWHSRSPQAYSFCCSLSTPPRELMAQPPCETTSLYWCCKADPRLGYHTKYIERQLDAARWRRAYCATINALRRWLITPARTDEGDNCRWAPLIWKETVVHFASGDRYVAAFLLLRFFCEYDFLTNRVPTMADETTDASPGREFEWFLRLSDDTHLAVRAACLSAYAKMLELINENYSRGYLDMLDVSLRINRSDRVLGTFDKGCYVGLAVFKTVEGMPLKPFRPFLEPAPLPPMGRP